MKKVFGVIYNALFFNSTRYWKIRYKKGGDSGAGSYGRMAQFKADVINELVEKNNIKTIVELGCGDGSQLTHARYPSYVGYDISPVVVEKCRNIFSNDQSKTFTNHVPQQTFDLSMSIDVIYHLTEDKIFDRYMTDLFNLSQHYILIFSTNYTIKSFAKHLKHRKFTDWVEHNRPEWKLVQTVLNKYPYNPNDLDTTSDANFYLYEKKSA